MDPRLADSPDAVEKVLTRDPDPFAIAMEHNLIREHVDLIISQTQS